MHGLKRSDPVILRGRDIMRPADGLQEDGVAIRLLGVADDAAAPEIAVRIVAGAGGGVKCTHGSQTSTAERRWRPEETTFKKDRRATARRSIRKSARWGRQDGAR